MKIFINFLSILLGLFIFNHPTYASSTHNASILYEKLNLYNKEYDAIMNSTQTIINDWNNFQVQGKTVVLKESDIDFSKLVKVYEVEKLKTIDMEKKLEKLPYTWELPVHKDGNSFVYIFTLQDNTWAPRTVLIYENEIVDYLDTLQSKVSHSSSLHKENYYFVKDVDVINTPVAVGYKENKAVNVIPVEKSSEKKFTSTENSSYFLSSKHVYSYDEVVTTIKNVEADFLNQEDVDTIDFIYLHKFNYAPYILLGILVVACTMGFCIYRKKKNRVL